MTQPVAEALVQRGFDPVIDPLLEIRPLDFTLPRGDFAAALITSANALPALASLARTIPVLTVGEATADAARQAGFAALCLGQSVEEAIGPLSTQPGPILYLSGQDIAHPVNGVTRVPVYVARQLPLQKATIQLLSDGQIDWIVLFSTRSAEGFEKVVRGMTNREWMTGTGLVCLSARTADPLRGHPWRDIVIAAQPTTTALIAALEVA